MRAKKTAALPLPQHLHRCIASMARQAFAAIDPCAELKVPRTAVGTGEVAQGATSLIYRQLQHLLNGPVQSERPWLANAMGRRGRPDAGKKQGFGSINIADADHQTPRQQHLLDRHAAGLERDHEGLRKKAIRKRFNPELAQQFLRHCVLFMCGIHHCTKTARVVQAQRSLTGHQVDMIVYSASRQDTSESQAARHAQVHQQHALIQIHQKVFTAPAHSQNMASDQTFRVQAQRPAQRFPQLNRYDACPRNGAGKAAACDLDFRQLRHKNSLRNRLACLDYYDSMVHTQRLLTAALTAALLTVPAAFAAQPLPPAAPLEQTKPAQHSSSDAALDAELFYEILLGEITFRSGDPGSSFALMLEAARRSNDEKLYKRAVDIAVQSREGAAALTAARAWKEAWPQSREANRYVLQLLIAMNRVAETAGPLQQELTQVAPLSKKSTLQSLPQMFRRVSDKALAASLVEQALQSDLENPAAGADAWVAVGRMRLLAGNEKDALTAVQRAQQFEAQHEGAVLLALELLSKGYTAAEPAVLDYLSVKPNPELRVVYARVLVDLQQFGKALEQLLAATQENPQLSEAWLIQAALQLQEQQLTPAEASLKQFIAQTKADGATPPNLAALTRAYALYAQIAEKRGDFAAAEDWLNHIDNAPDVFNAQIQRAALLARHGQVPRARVLLRNLPASTEDETRLKLVAEAQVLREAGQYQEALAVQTQAVEQFPDSDDLLYEQAMLADRAGKPVLMEQLLRKLIARQPDYHHAYNALGYALADRGTRLKEAKELIQKALSFAPDDPFIQDSLGWVEFRLGNRAEAVRLLEAAFQKRPDAEIAAHLGEVLWSMGQQDRARQVWTQAQKRGADNETLRSTLKRLGVAL